MVQIFIVVLEYVVLSLQIPKNMKKYCTTDKFK